VIARDNLAEWKHVAFRARKIGPNPQRLVLPRHVIHRFFQHGITVFISEQNEISESTDWVQSTPRTWHRLVVRRDKLEKELISGPPTGSPSRRHRRVRPREIQALVACAPGRYQATPSSHEKQAGEIEDGDLQLGDCHRGRTQVGPRCSISWGSARGNSMISATNFSRLTAGGLIRGSKRLRRLFRSVCRIFAGSTILADVPRAKAELSKHCRR
jgi:hypothetical protein